MKQKKRVLIVEDESLVAEMIQGMLEEMNFDIAGKAGSGLEAVEMTRTLQPTVVLMDIKMPDMDGIEASSRIQDVCPTPVVILTAYETPEMVKQASDAGVGAYLVKPPNAREIDRAIAIAVARFQDIMELRRINTELRVAFSTLKTLSGMLPICSHCKKIRNDRGEWQDVESYVREHSGVEFTHTICPICARRNYPEFIVDK